MRSKRFEDAAGTIRSRIDCTLLELVCAVQQIARDDRETVAILRNLIHSGEVRLIGALRGERLVFVD